MALGDTPGEPERKRQGGFMTGSIICGVDDSESAKGAARVARGLSSKLGLRLVFVRVVDSGPPDGKISAIAERLERLTACTTDLDCGAGWLVDVGRPADRLVAAAADEEAKFIVVGSTGPRSSLLGSVSAEVSRRAPCPVVVVPPGEGRDENELLEPIERSGLASKQEQTRTDAVNVRDFAGGIVRFGLGGRPDGDRSATMPSESEGGATPAADRGP
jgi:nucleotide-binding universal stress UspA family protein